MITKTKLFSRKNQVSLVKENDIEYVEKIFVNVDKFKNEQYYHNMLSKYDINVPKSYEYVEKESMIKYQYIDGTLLSVILSEAKVSSFINMGKYLRGFHDIFQEDKLTVIAGDVNLRNFIEKDGEIFPLDYEEYKFGEAHEDVSTFLSHLASHREVPKDIKIAMGKAFLESYYYEKIPYPNLEKDIILKARRLANWRGLGELEQEIIEMIIILCKPIEK